jgi:DNA (cytosine-5)-methyltransferase 1
MINKKLKGVSLFSGAGIGETYFKDIGIDIVVANELIKQRANLYKSLNPNCNMICGDITNSNVFNKIIDALPNDLDFLIASPPCQGMSVAGKNRCQTEMELDERNYLITYVVKLIEIKKPDYIIIENVPMLLKFLLNYKGKTITVLEILQLEFGNEYNIDSRVVDAADYGVPQTRLRAIIKMHKKGLLWDWAPKKNQQISVQDAIGYLPSLEAGESSNIKWHFARPHTKENILWMKHTPTGKTAFWNPIYYPQKKDGTRIKGYESSYRRIRWDIPAPTITMRNDCIASQRNVHPGRKLPDGTYSDARVLTPLELMILDSLPIDWNIPDDTPELLIRQCIGESIPPLMLKEIVGMIGKTNMMNNKQKIKAISVFSSAGIGELLLHNTNVEVIAGNELLPKRAECYQHFYPNAEMYCGDITSQETKNHMIAVAKNNNVKMLIATPPCQGLSTLGKNKKQAHYEKDKRNYLILHAIEIIDQCDFDYILIENVPTFLEMYFPYENDYLLLKEILEKKYANKYDIDIRVLNAKDYGVCQSRPRAIIKLYKHGLKWSWPTPQKEISLSEAIGFLPSLEAGEDSGIPWHYAKPCNERATLALKHTPTGKSALTNEVYYPKKEDGTRIKGFHNTFKRMTWDEPCPTRTTFSGSMSSHNNVHPGRLLPDGTYSDARVLTLLETFIVSSIPNDINFPKDSTDTFIRTVIGEAIPPKLMMEVVNKIGE